MACGYSGRSLAFPEHLCIHPTDMLCVLDTSLQYCLFLGNVKVLGVMQVYQRAD